MSLESFRENQDTLKSAISQEVGVEVADVNLTFEPANQERQIESTGNTQERCFLIEKGKLMQQRSFLSLYHNCMILGLDIFLILQTRVWAKVKILMNSILPL